MAEWTETPGGMSEIRNQERVPTRMPRWYVPFYAVYDWVYAAGLLGIWWMKG